MLQWDTPKGTVTILPACPRQVIENLGIDNGLGFFWHHRADLQKQALLKIADQPFGSVTVAHNAEHVIVGYVTIDVPDAETRWGRDGVEGLLELGGIEVSPEWRGLAVGGTLLKSTFSSGVYDRSIVIATGYRWCWDVESSGLTVTEYRDRLNKLFQRYGFKFFETDEPNIAWYPDNALVARIGQRASTKLRSKFKGLLFERLGADYASSEFLR